MRTRTRNTQCFCRARRRGNYLDFDIDRKEAARYGLTVGDVQNVIQTAMGGMSITNTVEGLERYPVNLRYSRELRDNIEALRRVLVPTPTAYKFPLVNLRPSRREKVPWLYEVKTHDPTRGSMLISKISTSERMCRTRKKLFQKK